MSVKKKVIVLGITGHLGKITCDLIFKFQEYEIVGFSYYQNLPQLAKMQKHLKQASHYYSDSCYQHKLKIKTNYCASLVKLESEVGEYDVIINCTSGIDSLDIIDIALSKNKTIYNANKQIIVLAGQYFINKYLNFKKLMLPLDSEHASIYSLVSQNDCCKIYKLYITMSGGSLRNTDPTDYYQINKDQLFIHPVWKMGINNTFDSNTLINKLFELLECYYFFGIPLNKVNAILHYNSDLHAIVEWNNGQMTYAVSKPSMYICMQEILFPNINKIFDSKFRYIQPPDILFHAMNKYQKAILSLKKLFAKNMYLGILLMAINDIFMILVQEEKITIDKLINFYNQNFKNYKHLIKNDYNTPDEIKNSYKLIKNKLKDKYFK